MRHRNSVEGEIITLFRPEHCAKQGIIAEIFNYWEELRADRVAPIRSEIDPRKISTTLQNTFILERMERGAARFRLAGIEVCDLLGMEVRGMPAHALFDAVDRIEFNDTLDHVLDTPHIAELGLRGHIAADRIINAKMILMPLQDAHGKMSRVLGAVVLEQELLRPPVRFTIERCSITRIISENKPKPQYGLNESGAEFSREPKRPPTNNGRPNLKLVKFD